jgi:hypothetical protein
MCPGVSSFLHGVDSIPVHLICQRIIAGDTVPYISAEARIYCPINIGYPNKKRIPFPPAPPQYMMVNREELVIRKDTFRAKLKMFMQKVNVQYASWSHPVV